MSVSSVLYDIPSEASPVKHPSAITWKSWVISQCFEDQKQLEKLIQDVATIMCTFFVTNFTSLVVGLFLYPPRVTLIYLLMLLGSVFLTLPIVVLKNKIEKYVKEQIFKRIDIEKLS